MLRYQIKEIRDPGVLCDSCLRRLNARRAASYQIKGGIVDKNLIRSYCAEHLVDEIDFINKVGKPITYVDEFEEVKDA